MKNSFGLLVVCGIIILISSAVWPIGGELGNGRSLKAQLMGFELTYPKDWNELSMEYLVSLCPPEKNRKKSDDEHISDYSVALLELPDVATLSDLNSYLVKTNPTHEWKESNLDGVFGFKESITQVSVLEFIDVQEFYLKEPGQVLRISYRLTSKHLPEIFAIHQSFRWMK